LAQLIPEWEQKKEAELNEKRSLELAKGQLGALYSKQGRLSKFKTQRERDNYLTSEIASVGAFRQSQLAALQTAQQDLASNRTSLQDIEARVSNTEAQAGEGKERVKALSTQIATLKNESAELTERRKELWREETKLASQTSHAVEERRSAERNLASMMDKVRVACLSEGGVMIYFASRKGHGHGVEGCQKYHRSPETDWRVRPTLRAFRNPRQQLQHCHRIDCGQ
jgi:structural maintenance of chromosome 3 (chondroitin sulfate proteoglycan 6)